ncbi:MAG: MFS transporter [Firmicutes bacterium]|nr:MFS transporter [Bacillota bacterium]
MDRPYGGGPILTDTIWRDRNFLLLWVSSSLSALADSAYFIVLAWTVVSSTHSELALGTTLMLAALPRLALMLLGGVAADRVSPKLLLTISLGARALILAALALAFSAGMAERARDFYVVALLFGTVDAFYWPTQGAIVPRVVTSARLATANSVIQTAQQLATVLGPLLAGVLLRFSPDRVFFSVAILYLIAVATVVFLHIPRWAGAFQDGPGSSPWTDLVTGLRYVFQVRVMAVIMGIAMVMSLLFMGPINVGLPTFISHHGWSGTIYGYFESALGVGAILGGLLTMALKGLRGHYRWIGIVASLIGWAFAGVSMIHGWPMGVALMAIAGAGMSITTIPTMTYIQTIADEALLGRVMSLFTLMSIGLTPVSYALCSWILSTQLLKAHQLMFASGILLALLFLSLFLFPEYRTMEDHPRWRHQESASR